MQPARKDSQEDEPKLWNQRILRNVLLCKVVFALWLGHELCRGQTQLVFEAFECSMFRCRMRIVPTKTIRVGQWSLSRASCWAFHALAGEGRQTYLPA